MNQKHLLKFIKKTIDEDGDKPCCVKDGKELTLNQVFASLNMNAYALGSNIKINNQSNMMRINFWLILN